MLPSRERQRRMAKRIRGNGKESMTRVALRMKRNTTVVLGVPTAKTRVGKSRKEAARTRRKMRSISASNLTFSSTTWNSISTLYAASYLRRCHVPVLIFRISPSMDPANLQAVLPQKFLGC